VLAVVGNILTDLTNGVMKEYLYVDIKADDHLTSDGEGDSFLRLLDIE